MPLPKNLEVARKARLQPLNEIAAEIGIGEYLLEPYGESVAKISSTPLQSSPTGRRPNMWWSPP